MFVIAPSVKPRDFTASSQSPISLTFWWDNFDNCERNGPSVIHYNVHCRKDEVGNHLESNITVQEGVYNLVILNKLRPDTMYNCSILAFKDVGRGPETSIRVKTLEPGKVSE